MGEKNGDMDIETLEKPSSGSKVNEGSDEALMAAIAHAGIIITIIVPLVIWLIKKEESEYVGFQAKQALVYQIAIIVVGLVASIVFFVLGVVTLGLGFILYLLLIPAGLAATVYALYGAYVCFKGEDFRYVILADML